jgi:hypothetical protein
MLAMIAWRPIAELPDELKDGRNVLLWDGDEPAGYEVVVASFSDMGGGEGDWRNDEFVQITNPTHFAEINAPPSKFAIVREVMPRKEIIRGEVEVSVPHFIVTGDFRTSLEAVEPDRLVRIKEGPHIAWEGTAGELLELSKP